MGAGGVQMYGVRVGFDAQSGCGFVNQPAMWAARPDAQTAVGRGDQRRVVLGAGGDAVQALPYREQGLVVGVGADVVRHAAGGCGEVQQTAESGNGFVRVEPTGVNEVGDGGCGSVQ